MSRYAFTIAGTDLEMLPSGAVYWPLHGLICVSDLHLGRSERYARNAGALLPPYETRDTLTRLEADIEATGAGMVVCLGDSFDDLAAADGLDAPISDWLTRLMAGRRWIWIEGNHDPEAPVGVSGDWYSEFYTETLVFRHEPSRKPTPGEVAGHYHPVARVVRRGKGVRRACFATDGDRLLMPAFGSTTGGLLLDHPAIKPLFDTARLAAHLIGSERIYSIAYSRLQA